MEKGRALYGTLSCIEGSLQCTDGKYLILNNVQIRTSAERASFLGYCGFLYTPIVITRCVRMTSSSSRSTAAAHNASCRALVATPIILHPSVRLLLFLTDDRHGDPSSKISRDLVVNDDLTESRKCFRPENRIRTSLVRKCNSLGRNSANGRQFRRGSSQNCVGLRLMILPLPSVTPYHSLSRSLHHDVHCLLLVCWRSLTLHLDQALQH